MPRKSIEKTTQIRSLAATGFYSDICKDDMLQAILIRSPAASGKFKDLSYDSLPEGYYIFTANDIPGSKEMKTNDVLTKIFGFDNISYTGEPLGILVGPDKKKLEELAEEISVNFDIESLESALKNVITKNKHSIINLHEEKAPDFTDVSDVLDIVNNMPSLDTVIDKSEIETKTNKVIATREIKSGLYKTKSVEEAEKEIFETADYKLKSIWIQDLVNPKWHESDGAFCYTEGEKIHVYVPTKWVYHLQKTLSDVLKIKSEQIFIHKTKSTGIYSNGLYKTNQLAVQAAVASYLTKKPVKLVLSTNEQEQFMSPGVKTAFHYSTAVSKEGRIKALHIEIEIDVGSTNPFAQEITDRIAISSCNYYNCENLYIKAITHTSKNPPTAINIKSVNSQAFFAIENQIQEICKVTGMFPDDIREINSRELKKSDFPFMLELGNVNQTISNTIKISDFNRKYSSFHMDAIDRVEKDSRPFFALPLRGIGISSAYNVAGYCGKSSFANDSKVEVTLTIDNKVIIHTIRPSEVIQEIWKKTASDILQFPKQNIQINSDFELSQLPTNPEDAFSTICTINELIKKCCNDIKKKRFLNPLPISSKKSVSSINKKNWDKENFCGNPYQTTAFCTTAVEVELDTYSYNESVKGIWVTIDCGELFDEPSAIRKIKLEIQQELSMLVEGKTFYCDNITINFIKSKNKSGQIGELIHNTLPAAFSSALSLALATQLTKLPCTERQIHNLIKSRGEK